MHLHCNYNLCSRDSLMTLSQVYSNRNVSYKMPNSLLQFNTQQYSYVAANLA